MPDDPKASFTGSLIKKGEISMLIIQKLTNQKFARSAAGFMNFVCWLLIALLVLCTILSFIGRQTFILHTDDGIYESAICAEEDHASYARFMTVGTGDDIHVWTDSKEQISLTVQLSLALMYAIHTVPLMLAFWFLSRVFSNVREERIFTEQNASYLLYYGLLQIFAAVCVPFLRLLICRLVSFIPGNHMEISTGQDMLNTLFPGIAFLVAAYIIHYGVNLQDEVDHTL